MKVAAIDIGSNSVHLVVSRVYAPGVREVLDREREMLQLGRSCFHRGAIPAAELDRAIDVLRRYRAIAEAHGVEAVLAVATSAVRDARNRRLFLERAEKEARLVVRVLTGEEEGRMIYAGARDALPVTLGKISVIDIGGGSVEVVIGDGPDVRSVRCFKLGVLRLAARLRGRKPKDVRRFEKEMREEIGPAAREVARAGVDAAVGTSGTILTVADLLGVRDSGGPIRLGPLEALVKRLLSESPGKLAAEGVDPKRVDTVGPGAALLRIFMEEAELSELIHCERALREGVVADYALRNASRLEVREGEIRDPRRRSVHFLARRLGALDLHARHTARLALRLFDGLAPLHELGAQDRELLEYAALLHDAGYWISSDKHHKHAFYLIHRAPLEGFTRDEIRMIALVARYHRGTPPKDRHEEFAKLGKADRRRVRVLSALLRIADGLDRSHAGLVQELDVEIDGKAVTLQLSTQGDLELELYAVENRSELFRRIFERDVQVKLNGKAKP